MFWHVSFCDLSFLSDEQNIGFTFLTIAQMAESRELKIPECWLLKLRDSKLSKSGTPYICHPVSTGDHATGTKVPAFSVTVKVLLPVCTRGISDGHWAVVGSTWRKSRSS